jgi:hypothetical protein
MNNNLKTAILTTGSSVQDFARVMGWPTSKVSKIIHGQYLPSFREEIRILLQLRRLAPQEVRWSEAYSYEAVWMRTIPEDVQQFFRERERVLVERKARHKRLHGSSKLPPRGTGRKKRR